GDLAEAGVGHFGQLALVAGADPGAARRLLVEETHLAEELAAVEVSQHHFVAFLVLDHHFDGAADDVVEDIREVARVDDHGLGGNGANSTVTQKPVDRRNVTQRLDRLFHTRPPTCVACTRERFLYICPQNCKRSPQAPTHIQYAV